jgi:hypothetical protein
MDSSTFQAVKGYPSFSSPRATWVSPIHHLDSNRNLFLFCSMASLPTRKPINEVDPNRFTGKTLTRRKTFPESIDDYSIRIDGLTAGRIMKKKLSFQQVVWFWTITAPYYPSNTLHNGEEKTFEAARDAFKRLFWEWQTWALKQPGKVTWYGADG